MQLGTGPSLQQQQQLSQYVDPMKLMFDTDPENPNHQAVLGGPMMAKAVDIRQSYQNVSPRSLAKNSNRKGLHQVSNVYNSVHLPSLRG